MKRLLLVTLMVLVTLIGMVGFSRVGNAVGALQATVNAGDKYRAYYDPKEAVAELSATVNAGVPAKPKMYYLTNKYFDGADAITACDSGFHMASLSEIQDPSNLQYAPKPTPVYDSHDSPPFDQASDQFPDHTGWVRTEAEALTGLVYNCDVWRSSSDQQSGATMTRRSLWGENNGHSLSEEPDPAAWWQSTQTASCDQRESVWCVENTICAATTDQQGGDCIF